MRFTAGQAGPTGLYDVAETLRIVSDENVRLQNHGGSLVIASSVDDRLRDSIQQHAATLLPLAVVVEPVVASVVSPRETSTVMTQLKENRARWLGIAECADIALHLTAAQTAEFKDRIDRCDSKVTRWGIVREMFSTGFRLKDDGNGF